MKQREIKVKIWDKECKKFGSSLWHGIEVSTGKLVGLLDGKPVYTDRFIIIQYTGLKDKNGKEICFTDLVKLKGSKLIWEVKKDDFGIPLFEANASNDEEYQLISFEEFFLSEFGTTRHIKLIGNIYENKELLK